MSAIATALTGAYVRLQEAARREDGEISLEYIVIVVFVIVAAAVGFTVFGDQLTQQIEGLIDRVLGNRA